MTSGETTFESPGTLDDQRKTGDARMAAQLLFAQNFLLKKLSKASQSLVTMNIHLLTNLSLLLAQHPVPHQLSDNPLQDARVHRAHRGQAKGIVLSAGETVLRINLGIENS